MSETPLREVIENVISDLGIDFLYYDRKEDEDLPRGSIEAAVADGVITKREIVKLFAASLGDL